MMRRTTGSLLRLNRLGRFHYRKQDTIKVLFSSTSEREESKVTTTSVVPGIAAAAGVSTFGFLSADVLSKGLLAMQGGGFHGIGSVRYSRCDSGGTRVEQSHHVAVQSGTWIQACSTTLLRAGIICVGFKLSFFEMASLGAYGVPCVAASREWVFS